MSQRSSPHTYTARLIWEGNHGEGTERYQLYGREYRILIAGKPDLLATADRASGFSGVDEGAHVTPRATP